MKKWISLLLALVMLMGIATTAMAAETDDAVGTISGNVYNNSALGISMTLPANWRFLSDAELASQMGYASQYGSRQGLATLLSQTASACGMYATATDDAVWTAHLVVQDLGIYKSLDEQTLFDLTKEGISESLKGQGYTNIQLDKTTFQLAGKDHVGGVLTADLGFIQTHMIVVLVKGDRFMGSLTVASLTEDKAREVLGYFSAATKTNKTTQTNTVHDQISAAIAKEDWETALKLLDSDGGKTYPDYANVRQNCFNQANYSKAKQAMENKYYYTAYTLFSQMGKYKDAASLAAKCKRPTPETGEMSRNSEYRRKTVKFLVKNELRGGYNIYVRIYDPSGTTFVCSLFITSGKGAVIYLPDKSYLMKAAYGKGTWFGENEMFGDDAIYKELFTFSLEQVGRYGYWYCTIDDEMAYTTIDRQDF